MGIDTGADKKYIVTDNKEVIFKDFYDDIEGENFKYPNAEFVTLADSLKDLSDGKIDIRKYLIWDDLLDYENPDFTHIIEQLQRFTFEDAISEGEKGKKYIEDNHEKVNQHYRYIHDAMEVIEYLIGVWKKGYYINYSY